MDELFLKIVNMSISASWMVLAILLLRLIFKKAPRRMHCFLWALVGVRLVLPISFESVLSLIPSVETFNARTFLYQTPTVQTGISSANAVINPILEEYLAPNGWASINPTQVYTFIAARLWIIGIAAMVIYAAVSYIRICLRVRESVRLYDNVRMCDRIPSPFILGIIRPKIYLPSDIDEYSISYVLAHEKAHLKRLDHIWKPLGFLLLTVFWFNPLLWAAYILLCRDIELACDQRVITAKDEEYKKHYSEALLRLSAPKRFTAACPLAFGEGDTKRRIKGVLSFKKPTVWVLILSVVLCIAVAVCFLTDPIAVRGVQRQKSDSTLEGISIKITDAELSGISPYIEIEWKNKTKRDVTYGQELYIYKKDGASWEDCRINEDYAFSEIGYHLAAGRSTVQKLYLGDQAMGATGRYRIDKTFTVDGDTQSYTASVEFDLTAPVSAEYVYDLDAVELVYSNGMYSSVSDIDYVYPFRLVNSMTLQQMINDTTVKELGHLEEITLSRTSFDSRFDSYQFKDAEKLRKQNHRAWQLEANINGIDTLYILLQQRNGDFYLGEGYYNVGSDNPANEDDSLIRYLYRLEPID